MVTDLFTSKFNVFQVSEETTESLFSDAITAAASSTQADSWSQMNGPDTSWNDTPKEESPYLPEKYV